VIGRIGRYFGKLVSGRDDPAGGIGGYRRRRTFRPLLTIVTLVALTLTACGTSKSATTSSSSSSSSVPVHVTAQTFLGIPSSWLTQVAQAEGFFTKNDLNVSLLPVNTGAQAVAALASGSADIIFCAPDTCASLQNQGEKLTAFAGEYNTLYAIMVRKGFTTATGYKATILALKGKTVGVPGLGTGGQFIMEALLQGAGLAPDAVTFVPTGGVPQALAALQSGQIDAWTGYPPGITEATTGGYATVAIDLRKPNAQLSSVPLIGAITGVPYFAIYSTTAWAGAHPAAVDHYRLALEEADCWIHAPANLKKLTTQVQTTFGAPTGLTATALTAYVESNIPLIHSYYPKSSAKAWTDYAVHFGIMKSPVAVNSWLQPGTPSTANDVIQAVKAAGGSCPGGA